MVVPIDGFAREELDYYLKHLSELVKARKITGWDVRNGRPDESANRDVHYTHADVAEDHPHYAEVVEAIKEVTSPAVIETINISIAERTAYFRQRDIWVEPERQNFYDFDGNELTFENEKLYYKDGTIHTGPFLAEQKQQDMRIPATEDEVDALIEVFRDRACKWALLEEGSYKRDSNKNLIPNTHPKRFKEGSWDVPLIVSPKPHICMIGVQKYSLLPKNKPIGSYAMFLFHGNKLDLDQAIERLTELYKIEDVSLYANRAFVDEYLKVELTN